MTTTKDARPPTAGERAAADVRDLLRARNTLLWITSTEELRVERALTEAAAAAEYEIATWDCHAGIVLRGTDGREVPQQGTQDPNAALAFVRDRRARRVYVLRDLHKWTGDPVILRAVRNLVRDLQSEPRATARALIVLSPSSEIPPEWQGQIQIVAWPLPDRAEVAAIHDDTIAALRSPTIAAQATAGREAAIDAALGLPTEEIAACYSLSLVRQRRIDPGAVAGEKRRVIAREGLLTWYDPDPRGLAALGGYENLKTWLLPRRDAFGPEARAYGLPPPKGVLLVGVPGAGKSLTAKAIATAWQMPLLRLDAGGLKSKFVGESEQNFRRACALAETVSPCVLWIDELEKALAGATGPAGDGGVAADALGALLSWMQDRKGSVFVVATANDVRALPPELLRKGRFDELFFFDLPSEEERIEILRASLGERAEGIDLAAVAQATPDFVGAELAALVPEALYSAFADGRRPIRTDDLLTAARYVVPLAKTASEKIENLRAWARSNARPASGGLRDVAPRGGRQLDL